MKVEPQAALLLEATTSETKKRIPVALPDRPGGFGGHLMATFFKMPNAVAVSWYQNPALPATARVYMAVGFGCVQDANAVATYEAGTAPTVLAEMTVPHIAHATGLHTHSVQRSLLTLEAAGAIYWRRGDARHKPGFATCLNPRATTASVSGSKRRNDAFLAERKAAAPTTASGGVPTTADVEIESAPSAVSKEMKEEEKEEGVVITATSGDSVSRADGSGKVAEAASPLPEPLQERPETKAPTQDDSQQPSPRVYRQVLLAFTDLRKSDEGWGFLRNVDVRLEDDMLTLVFPTNEDYAYADRHLDALTERLSVRCMHLFVKQVRLRTNGPTLEPVADTEVPVKSEVLEP